MKKASWIGLAALVLLGGLLWQARSKKPTARSDSTDSPLGIEEPSLDVQIPPPDSDRAPLPSQTESALATQLSRWLLLMRTPGQLSEAQKAELAAIELQLLNAGEEAVPPILKQLAQSAQEPALRERLFNVLRQLPGKQVEPALIAEATHGGQASTRTMAMESLGALKTPAALQALTQIAQHDPDLPSQPLITSERNADDRSTELPDEKVFTPRMQAMAALASSGDPQAVDVLTRVARGGPDESLRMEAARHLAGFKTQPQAVEALRVAAATDPSPYVRLSALHSLKGNADPSVWPVLEQVATNDRDAGVRLLAQQVLDEAKQQ